MAGEMANNAMDSNTTVSSSNPSSAGAGITGGYEGNSTTLRVLIVFFPALAMYNVVELVILIFFTFSKYRGLYFWSLLVSSLGIIPYSLGFLFKFSNITTGTAQWLNVVLLTIGWYTMVTGQAVVLWSRLHLIVRGVRGDRILKWTKWMIMLNVVILHVPTTVLTFGSNGTLHTGTFVRGYNVMEKIQMSGFFLQEVILSTIYIVSTVQILRVSIREDTRRIMYQLFAINVIIILMDLALLGLEAASLYLLETITKGVFYSIKLKLEFAILSKLVQFVGGRENSVANEERSRQMSVSFFGGVIDEKRSRQSCSNTRTESGERHIPSEVADLVDMTRTVTNSTQAKPDSLSNGGTNSGVTNARKGTQGASISRIRPGMSGADVDIALFEHLDNTSLPPISPVSPQGPDQHQASANPNLVWDFPTWSSETDTV